MATLEQVLSGRNLTGVIQGVKSGLVTKVPDPFLTPTRNVNGNTIEWFQVDGTRQLARIAQYGSPAKRRGLQGISQKSATALHAFESQNLPAQTLLNLLDPDSEGTKQQLGRQEVARQTREFKVLFSNLRIAAVQMALATGTLYFDEDGNLLPSSSGAMVSIDFSIPAGNQDQLDVFGDGDLITASWGTASTKIISHIKNIKAAAIKKTGYPIMHAFYGANIPQYLASNTEAKEYLIRNPQANQTFIDTGEVPQGLGGLTWHSMQDAFFADQDNTIQSILGDDAVVFTPDPTPDWYELVQGSFVRPIGLGQVGSDANQMLGQLEEAFGMFSYAVVGHNPPTIEQFAGDTFLPLIKVPGAMFIADVTP